MSGPDAAQTTMSSKEIVQRLQDRGLWVSFCKRRDAIASDLKVSPREANDRAVAEFMPAIEADVSDLPKIPHGQGEAASVGPTGQTLPAASPNPMQFADRRDYVEFMSRDADIVEQINWVAKNLDVDLQHIELDDIPCAEAWNMLVSYRRSPDRKDEFWDKVYPRLIPGKPQLDAKAGIPRVDGDHVLETIERIQAMKRKREKLDSRVPILPSDS